MWELVIKMESWLAPDHLNHTLHFNKICNWNTSTLKFEKHCVTVLSWIVAIWVCPKSGDILSVLWSPGKTQFNLSHTSFSYFTHIADSSHDSWRLFFPNYWSQMNYFLFVNWKKKKTKLVAFKIYLIFLLVFIFPRFQKGSILPWAHTQDTMNFLNIYIQQIAIILDSKTLPSSLGLS